MSLSLIVILFLLGFAGSFLSGLVGIGGAIINYPLLLYVPAALGVASYTAHEVSGITAVQVFFAALSGALALRKAKVIHYKLVAYMGVAILIGSFGGAYGGKFLSSAGVNTVYAILATLAVVMMFAPKTKTEDLPVDQVRINYGIAVASALLVGGTSGVVGAGGAFLLVPILLTVLKIPTRVTLATSLAITFLSSIGSTIGKVMAGDVLWGPATVLVVASVLAAPLGAKMSGKVPSMVLRTLLVLLIASTAGKVWFEIYTK
ncbi:sulfite exporter TauE/SafE family protein [Tumebacillus flagellatus]|uniref:Probable membrane transporter protein n=1 Tax=Tumebacillus flagellatus TaxID=1157490 RepID=A0A074LRL0_9BACL|nr:sulfite exporter TauE/SafE family protein [Tumebacillus flagellatus]KEO82473.1 membrane protein [Tumebacillus flagellatus]